MTAEMLIRELQNLPPKMQVRDSIGSPIYFAVKKEDVLHSEEGIFLESVRDMDVECELDAVFENAWKCGVDENDVFLYLGEKGLTLEDFKGSSYYEMALEYSKTHAW